MKSQTNGKKRVCGFCLHKVEEIDYKDVGLLRRYLSSFGKIVARKRSKVCMGHQRQLAVAVKRSRIMALIPFIQR
ncbi:30S ribosomal protein S18 [Candidatus Uhrbacteria bacterium]|nr:30S ribosomal protein S18 [Candidatus Uhrbacteria bacterium]